MAIDGIGGGEDRAGQERGLLLLGLLLVVHLVLGLGGGLLCLGAGGFLDAMGHFNINTLAL